jgi:hypothetical protein
MTSSMIVTEDNAIVNFTRYHDSLFIRLRVSNREHLYFKLDSTDGNTNIHYYNALKSITGPIKYKKIEKDDKIELNVNENTTIILNYSENLEGYFFTQWNRHLGECSLEIENLKKELKTIKEQTIEEYKTQLLKEKIYNLIKNKITEDGLCLRYVDESDQTEELVLIAINQNPMAIQYSKLQTIKVQLELIAKSPELFTYIKDPCDSACMLFAKSYNKDDLRFKNMHDNITLDARRSKLLLDSNVDLLSKVIKRLDDDTLFEHIKNNPKNTKEFLYKSCGRANEFFNRLIELDGNNLQFATIELRSDKELCWKAIKNNVNAYYYCSREIRKDYEITKYVLERDGEMIVYSPHLNDELYKIAIRQNYKCIKHIIKKELEIFNYALEINPKSLEFIKDQTLEMCVNAVKKDSSCFIFVNKEFKEDVKMCLL